ncbi:MAG TPA: L,D-transpeptidase family protein [Chthoniobacterales bacterium]|jgi:murein L,D-transpeptidase YafK
MKKPADSHRFFVRFVVKIIFCLLATAAVAALIRTRIQPAKLSADTVDRIVVEKSARKLLVFRNGRELKSYMIFLGSNPVGHKQEEGDMKTPEGNYTIDYRNPHSDYHLALHISYPNPDDQARAAERGVSPGGDIMIHGFPNGSGWTENSQPQRDWTAGCIALTDPEIEELWQIVPDGTPIEIRP